MVVLLGSIRTAFAIGALIGLMPLRHHSGSNDCTLEVIFFQRAHFFD